MFDNVFRLNPLFTLTPFEDLSEDQKKKFRNLTNDKNFYGFLHAPREAKLTIKTVNRDLADFLRQLIEPKKLSDLFQIFNKGTKEEKEDFIIKLVLDSVLEVKDNNEFISGVEAVNRVLSPSTDFIRHNGDDSKKNHTQVLSDRSIHFALNSALIQPRDLSFLLYNFNRLPLSRRWKRRLPDEVALARYLDLWDDGVWPGMPKEVRPRPIRKDNKGEPNIFDLYWRAWRFKKKVSSKDKSSYKVYFSPLPQDLPDVFRMVRDAAAQSFAHSMKIGRNLSGILRADKLIVYFSEYPPALDFACKMSKTLTSFHYQGTPFSFQVNPDNPLVSMGVDPPRKFGDLFSWRLYITNKLSLAMQGARRTKAKNPINYIHTYMRMIGVDSYNWRPLSDDWSIEFQIEEQKNGQT